MAVVNNIREVYGVTVETSKLFENVDGVLYDVTWPSGKTRTFIHIALRPMDDLTPLVRYVQNEIANYRWNGYYECDVVRNVYVK